jgi:hypothetical protein
MTQPLGDCPGCGGDEPFEQVHVGWHADDQCPDVASGAVGECTEWVCSGCGAGVFMGTVIMSVSADGAGEETAAWARQSVRAA